MTKTLVESQYPREVNPLPEPVVWGIVLQGAGFLVGLLGAVLEVAVPTEAVLFFLAGQAGLLYWALHHNNFLSAMIGGLLMLMVCMSLVVRHATHIAYDGYITAAVLLPEIQAVADGMLLMSSALFFGATTCLAPRLARRHEPFKELASQREQAFARVATLTTFAAGLILGVLTIRGRPIFEAQYATSAQAATHGPVTSGGIELLGLYLLAASVVAAHRWLARRQLAYATLVVLVLAVAVYLRLLRGDRGGFLIIVTTIGAMLFVRLPGRRWPRALIMLMGVLGVLLLFETWGFVRANAADMGLLPALRYGIVEHALAGLTSGLDPTNFTLLDQAYWHLLHVVDLFQIGISLEGKSFWWLIPQAIPESLAHLIGFERPQNTAWILGQYRNHGGGFFTVAEAYWNLGVFGVLAYILPLAIGVSAIEHVRARAPPVLTMPYFGFVGSIPFGFFYSLQTFARMAEVAFLLAVVLYLGWKWHGRMVGKTTPETKPVAQPNQAAANPLPISVLIPVRNEARNLPRCLAAIAGWADEVVVIDSQSVDGTQEIARRYGAQVVQFHYPGGWPKKRQWALDNLPFRNPWILLLDADEVVTRALKAEIEQAIKEPQVNGYFLRLNIVFLGKELRYGGFHLHKLSLFRRGKGRFERRMDHHTPNMADMEIHEHVHVDGPTRVLEAPISHHNVNDLHRYIHKHNEYSTWQAEVYYAERHGRPSPDAIPPRLFGGTQAQRRRWVKRKLIHLPGSPIMLFVYRYIVRLGVLDGRSGLTYCAFEAVQEFHSKAKLRELEIERRPARSGQAAPVDVPSDKPRPTEDL